MRCHVKDRARKAGLRTDTDPHHDIGKLPYRRKRQSCLQIILSERNKRRYDNRQRCRPCQKLRTAAGDGKLRSEHIADHPQHTERACFDHRYRVQQGADRRRRDHGGRQPAVQRHHTRLDRAADNHRQK